MEDEVYKDSLSAWHGLIEVGGLEPDGRDVDLVTKLIEYLNPGATDLKAVLRRTSTEMFLSALFQVVQPFAHMYKDILEFFELANANKGQGQWKVSIGAEFVDFEHFQEFLDHWKTLQSEIEIPHLDQTGAFMLQKIHVQGEGYEHLQEDVSVVGTVSSGIADVDSWIEGYCEGEYKSFPVSLHPDNFPPGLSDVAATIMAALSIIQRLGKTREELISEHRARGFMCDPADALHPSTIAQNETDYWLRTSILSLAVLLGRSNVEREAYGDRLVPMLANYPRRSVAADITVNDIEKLLSLPAWNKRYDFYGVWVATQIVDALKDHDTVLHGENGELKFAFSEARIADFTSAQPSLSLYSERKIKSSNVISKKRKAHVQPDYGLWTSGDGPQNCKLIIEVKHYKKRSRENFRSALHDYAHAHPNALVLLVNYGPVGAPFDDLPSEIEGRCRMIEHLRPDEPNTLSVFHKTIREQVGEPVVAMSDITESKFADIDSLVIDISVSMSAILSSDWFKDFIHRFNAVPIEVILVDHEVKATVSSIDVLDWLAENSLGSSTSLVSSISFILERNENILLVTDQDGYYDLRDLEATIATVTPGGETNVQLLRVS